MGYREFPAPARHVRRRYLAGARKPARSYQRSPWHQAALLRNSQRQLAFRFRAESHLRTSRYTSAAFAYRAWLLSFAELRSQPIYLGGRHSETVARKLARMAFGNYSTGHLLAKSILSRRHF